ncbi:MAG: hypothetical protein EBW19_09805 [Betaproteobacteria bacterium]|nr:hypothetical protein [Betaproteobacteria bacterium]NCV90463.1 hypothetical protein [Betaproteobacteria bacterium]
MPGLGFFWHFAELRSRKQTQENSLTINPLRFLLDADAANTVLALNQSFVGRQRSGDEFEQGGLSTAIATDKSEAITALNRERGAIEQR